MNNSLKSNRYIFINIVIKDILVQFKKVILLQLNFIRRRVATPVRRCSRGGKVGGFGSADPLTSTSIALLPSTKLVKRIIACLDVRSNDEGDLIVTKGDQYDVRDSSEGAGAEGRGQVRNLGKPVALCKRYYDDGADEVVFLNITSFRQGVIEDLPMLQVLEQSSESVFVPLTVGGGIRSYIDENGKEWSALEVAAR